MEKAEPGLPPGLAKKTFGRDATNEVPGTTQISIIDDDGNAVSMTATIESAFGSHLWAAGFLLNNELTDFSFVPVDANGNAVANAVAGGKRPRSSMAPTIVLDQPGHARDRHRLAGRLADHPLRRQDARGDARLGSRCAASGGACRISAAKADRS